MNMATHDVHNDVPSARFDTRYDLMCRRTFSTCDGLLIRDTTPMPDFFFHILTLMQRSHPQHNDARARSCPRSSFTHSGIFFERNWLPVTR